MGALFTTGKAGLDGFRPVTLFGKRFEDPVNCAISWVVNASFMVDATVSGSVIKLIPNFPIPPLAISLPRCGVQTKTPLLIRGLARNVIERTTKLSAEFLERTSLAAGPIFLSFSHIERVR